MESKKCFGVVGQFPAITQVLLGTTWTNAQILEILEFYYLQAEKKSEQTLKELIPLLCK
ncbi:hypothetical protein [Paenibacillus endoradicis]|uniref:hypothetical protein n=1 Tax=Paenibacillus endoradicis TaxID=2972487 RepID=UPI0021594174|nr:hypothetical protein [Paenibacillus endoradicis]MCR8656509.1 hypothetical protein [Paenibacillus endoradicis]